MGIRNQFQVGVGGFEPPTSYSQSKHSNRTELHPEIFDNFC